MSQPNPQSEFDMQAWSDTAPIGRVTLRPKCTVLVYPVGINHLPRFGNLIVQIFTAYQQVPKPERGKLSDADFEKQQLEYAKTVMAVCWKVVTPEARQLIAECCVPNVLELKPALPVGMMFPIIEKWIEVSREGEAQARVWTILKSWIEQATGHSFAQLSTTLKRLYSQAVTPGLKSTVAADPDIPTPDGHSLSSETSHAPSEGDTQSISKLSA